VIKHPGILAAVLEKPPADKLAKYLIAKRGLTDRISVIGADMFNNSLPSNFDIHLYSHVLHDWDEPEVKQLLSKSFESLLPDGMIAIHDTHINAKKTGPLAVSQYSVLLMHSTMGKCYSISEMETFLEDIGFVEIECIPTVAHRSLITAKKPMQ
jgi:hypothetical protein